MGLLAFGMVNSHAALVWTVGDRDTGGRQVPEIANIYTTTGTTTFIQETGVNALPGSATTPAVARANDDDFYFPGVYTNQVDGGPAYTTVGVVASQTDLGVERAITSGDLNNRYHFNFDASHAAGDTFTVSFGMLDNIFDDNTGTGFFNITVRVNGVDLGTSPNLSAAGDSFTSNSFTLADVNGTAGAADDNYVELRGSTGGSTARWQNFDYIRMDFEPAPVPEPSGSLLLLSGVLGLALGRRRR